MNLIACVDTNWGIGKENNLLYNIGEDLHHFAKITRDGIILMGRNTFLSLNSHPLNRRINIVMTKSESLKLQNILVVKDIDSLSKIVDISRDDLFLIGGEQMYRAYCNKCDFAFITKVLDSSREPDRFMVNLDIQDNWKLVDESETYEDSDLGLSYKFCTYKNLNKN